MIQNKEQIINYLKYPIDNQLIINQTKKWAKPAIHPNNKVMIKSIICRSKQ